VAHTNTHSFRIPNVLWDHLAAYLRRLQAAMEDTPVTMTDVVTMALGEYVEVAAWDLVVTEAQHVKRVQENIDDAKTYRKQGLPGQAV